MVRQQGNKMLVQRFPQKVGNYNFFDKFLNLSGILTIFVAHPFDNINVIIKNMQTHIYTMCPFNHLL